MRKVSCIIPYYNGQETIARAIDSVLYNQFTHEVIVVNDASPEPLSPHLQAQHHCAIASGRLKIIELATNHGQAAARNMAAAVSGGEFVSFLDQDDIYLPSMYTFAVPYLQAHPEVAALVMHAEIFNEGQSVLDESDPRYSLIISTVPWNIVIRKTVFLVCGGFATGQAFREKGLAGEDAAFRDVLRANYVAHTYPQKTVRHHLSHGSTTDIFLKRTAVVDGNVVFNEALPGEINGAFNLALKQHTNDATSLVKAHHLVAQVPTLQG